MNLSKILELENLNDYKIHAATYNGETEPLDAFARDIEEWHDWNRWRKNKHDFNKKYIISFMKFYPEYDTWLFGGIYKVLGKGAKNDHSYKIELMDEGKELIGRLKISANFPRNRALLLKNFYDELSVSEILKEPYSGEVFCGYENISHDFKTLQIIYNKELPDWKTALQNIKGVYCIIDKKTGKKYIGSASGENGIWSRWNDYIINGHGGNNKMKKLIKQEGIEYARNNFRMTLIEYWPFKTNDKMVTDRETFWKSNLLTREFGYNDN